MQSGFANLEQILKGGKIYSWNEILIVMKPLIESLVLLQQHGISNRDIKPSNIILVEEGKKNHVLYKISDFGIGVKIPQGCSTLIEFSTLKGLTRGFASPEILKAASSLNDSSLYDPFKSDVYSLGVTMFMMLEPRWKRRNPNVLLQMKVEGYEIPDLFQKMMSEDPVERFDFLKLNEYFKKMEQIDFTGRPMDEKKYYNEYLKIKKEAKIREIENTKDKNPQIIIYSLKEIYNEHIKFFKIYFSEVIRLENSKVHLDEAFEDLTRLEKVAVNAGVQEFYVELLILKTKIMFKYSNFYLLIGDQEKSFNSLLKSASYIGMFQNFLTNRSITPEEQNQVYNPLDPQKYLNLLSKFYILQGNLSLTKKDIPQSEAHFLKSLIIDFLFHEFCENNSRSALLYYRLACLHWVGMSNIESSMYFIKKSYNIYRNLSDKKNTIECLVFLADLSDNGGNFKNSTKYMQRALHCAIDLYGEKHLIVGQIYNSLGSGLGKNQDLESLYGYLMKALKIMRELFGEEHVNTGSVYMNLGMFYYQKGDYAQAEDYSLRSLPIFQSEEKKKPTTLKLYI